MTQLAPKVNKNVEQDNLSYPTLEYVSDTEVLAAHVCQARIQGIPETIA